MIDISIVSLWLAGLVSAFIIRELLSSDRYIRSLKERIRELQEQLREREKHYEQLLREAAIRNNMMLALWKAFVSGQLEKCYREGGKPRVLSDGVVICDVGEKSYTIAFAGGDEGAAR